ncbi:glutathione peroxidase [Rheinheimera nanhaiensis]|uniref:Glutathione peroxidase n=1 Tax=Rheinheimera nanhaiensis E407-8 TaxID=562729 RepID=I1DZ45_9GAMM|nr:glutathione peroxidase [Rheinheimera nanhaiensis]GAB59323.1 glutathione peroxidase [Rheinheimera nanhaiensis E407-8]
MKVLISAVALAASLMAAPALANQCGEILGHSMQQLNTRESVDLCDSFKGKTLLVVNTASKCGFTKQFEGLEALYQQYKDKGLVVLGFPSDSFMQEYDEAEKTAEVCYLTYGVKFPMFASSKVRGDEANPVFKALIAKTGESPSWNFNKYLVSSDEQTVKHFGSRTAPDDKGFIAELEKMLSANAAAATDSKAGE